MELKIKRLTEDAVLPIRAYKGDAGIDLTCTTITQELNECNQLLIVYHTGLAFEIPEGYVGLVFPRSSIYKKSLTFTNCVGVIDSCYRGEITAKMRSTTDVVPAIYKPGERFAQLVLVPIPEFTMTEVSELSETDRGENGYGSTDISSIPDDSLKTENTAEVNNSTVDTQLQESTTEQAEDSNTESETFA